MLQFILGFWVGCLAATLVYVLLYANKRRQMEEATGIYRESEEEYGISGKDGKEARKRFRILLVDDSRLSRTVMKGFLTGENLEIFEAGNGAEGLKLAQKYKFDLIFLDQNMPGMDGDETLQRLWIDGSVDDAVPVVAVGSSVRQENEAIFREKGYAACLGKPIQENRLVDLLKLLPQERETEEPEGFSYETGLKNFDGNDLMYRETLQLFAELWKERRENLKQFLEEENMPEYAILIHAIKGDARTLGAMYLGELAYEQELQAKEENAEAVRKGFDRVITTGDRIADFFVRAVSE